MYLPGFKFIANVATPSESVFIVYITPFMLYCAFAFINGFPCPSKNVALKLREVSPKYLVKSAPSITESTVIVFENCKPVSECVAVNIYVFGFKFMFNCAIPLVSVFTV